MLFTCADTCRRPKIIFSSLLSKQTVGELKVIVQRHHGMVETRAEQATHEIIPDVMQDEDDGDYCRTIQEQVYSLRILP